MIVLQCDTFLSTPRSSKSVAEIEPDDAQNGSSIVPLASLNHYRVTLPLTINKKSTASQGGEWNSMPQSSEGTPLYVDYDASIFKWKCGINKTFQFLKRGLYLRSLPENSRKTHIYVYTMLGSNKL